MNIQDVTGEAQYARMLLEQRSRLEAARARTGEIPADRKGRRELVRDHMGQYEQMKTLKNRGTHETYMKVSMVGEPYGPSVASVKELRKMAISELALETHHRGCYLLLRLFVPPVRMTALITLAEDEAGDVLTFSLYQQEGEETRPAEDLLPKDTVLLLKEPYFKVLGSGGGYGLRIDHPTDIVFLSNDDPMVPPPWRVSAAPRTLSAEAWKQKGNSKVQAGKFRDSIKDYTAALECSPTPAEAEVIHNNRALAHLRVGHYDAALRDAAFIEDPNERSEKALYRGSLALYNLGRFSECHETLKILTAKFPVSDAGKFELGRVQLRMKEQKDGIYDFTRMYRAATRPPHRLDCATFIGPVTVREIPKKGRGLVTTKKVKVGDLLFCEKAFSYGHRESSTKGGTGGSVGMLVNVGTKRVTLGTHVSLLTDIYQKLQSNPSTMAPFLDLYSGAYERASQASVDGQPVVDSFLIERIVALNVFGSALVSKDDDNQKRAEHDNLFGCSGLWLHAAYINHSCLSNCYRTFIGDMMLVRATQDLPAHTELGWSYANPQDRAQMPKVLRDSWGFACACALCQDDATTPKKLKAKRRQILATLATRDPREAAAAMEETYVSPATDVPRFELFQLCFSIAQHLVFEDKGGDVASGLLYGLKALEALGFMLEGVDMRTGLARGKKGLVVKRWGWPVEPLAKAWETLWVAWGRVEPKLAAEAERYWATAYALVQAGESETFEATYRLKQHREARDLALKMKGVDLGSWEQAQAFIASGM